jgi:hypothetical protein
MPAKKGTWDVNDETVIANGVIASYVLAFNFQLLDGEELRSALLNKTMDSLPLAGYSFHLPMKGKCCTISRDLG